MANNKQSKEQQSQQPSEQKKEIIAAIFIAIGILYFVALAGYSPQEIPFSGGLQVEKSSNYLGLFGSYIADFSFTIFGFSAWFFGFSLLIIASIIYQKKFCGINSWTFVVKFILFWIFIGASCGLFDNTFVDVVNTKTGGELGLALNQLLIPWFSFGVSIIYLMLMFISFSIMSGVSMFKLLIMIYNFSIIILNKIMFGFKFVIAKINQIIVNRKQAKATKKEFLTITPKNNKNPNKTITKPKLKLHLMHKQTPKPKLQNITNPNLPDISLLDLAPQNQIKYSEDELQIMADNLVEKLGDFGIAVVVEAITPGPVITSFEISLPAGVKASKVVGLDKDLARALLVESVRIIDVIPGKPVIGIEIPNANRQMIGLSEVIDSENYKNSDAPLTMCLGKDVAGRIITIDLAKTPHLLVAGATGMGKSVGLNAMLMGILYKSSPVDVRLIMIDPKVVELAIYADIPHLLTPVVVDMNEAASALFWCVGEMERRYQLLAKFSVRNISGFNDKIRQNKATGTPLLDPYFDEPSSADGASADELEELPLIVIIIDEYADMLGALAQEDRAKSKRCESFIIRLAQKARAAGMHLIIATQRPSVDVITGLIKSNIPSRVAFKVSSKIDSRTILDKGGAEQLLGMGDMLYMMPGKSHLTRVHGAFVSDSEIERVVSDLKANYPTNYIDSIIQPMEELGEVSGEVRENGGGELDPLYDEAVAIVTSTGKASISGVQRKLRIGYNRAARIIEDMEAAGVVSTMNSSGNRQVLAPSPI